MKRRNPSIISQIASAMRPILAGKIEVYSVGYRKGSSGYTNPQGVHFNAFPAPDGTMIELYKRRSVRCPSHHVGKDYAPYSGRGYSVPLTVCQKCENRIPGGCCILLRDSARNKGIS